MSEREIECVGRERVSVGERVWDRERVSVGERVWERESECGRERVCGIERE